MKLILIFVCVKNVCGQELEPTAGEQLLSVWSKSTMPGSVPPQPTRSVPAGVPSFVAPGHYLPPAEYPTTPFNPARQRPPQYSGWPPMNQWGMMGPPQRHASGYPPGPYQQDFAQHLHGSQFGYSPAMTKNYPGGGGGIYPASSVARHPMPASSNPSVMIMQRSDASTTK